MPTCPECGGFTPEGCTCAFESTDSVTITPSSTSALTVWPSLPLDPNTDNLLENSVTGLRTDPSILYVAKPRVKVTHSVDQVLGAGYRNPINFDSEIYDTHGMHDPNALELSYLQCTVDGLHHFGFQCKCTAAADLDTPYFALLLNGNRAYSEHNQPRTQDGSDYSVQLWAEVFMVPGDRLEVFVATAAALTILSNDDSAFFYGHWHKDAV